MTHNIGSTYVFGVFRTRSVHLTIYTMLRNESQPKMFCLITPQIKEEVICFLLYLRSLWNVVLDYDIKVEFWFRNGWLMTHMQTKNQSWWSLNPIFLSNIFVISTKVAQTKHFWPTLIAKHCRVDSSPKYGVKLWSFHSHILLFYEEDKVRQVVINLISA